MRSHRIRTAVLVAAMAAACTDAPPSETVIDQSTGTTSDNISTVSPVNGLPADPDLLGRRVIAVKIDNAPPARPQSGVQSADAVVEIPVEAGLTRFIALFHASDTEYVGPIRSLRPADIEIARALKATTVVSGGQPWILALAADVGVDVIGETTGTFRIDGRIAPHNLYGSTPTLRDTADGRGFADDPPQPWLPFGAWDPPDDEVRSVTIGWSGSQTVEWRYDAETGAYLRWANGVEHSWIDADGNAGQMAADVLIVLMVTSYMASDDEGTAVPAVETTGTGQALVFAGGSMWTGTWERESPADPFRFFDGDGNRATVPSGILWLSLVPDHRPVTIE